MLKKVKAAKVRSRGGHFAIVASRYNARFVDSMVRAAQSCLRAARVESVRLVRVPGAYEIPVVAARLARTHPPRLSGIICLGVVIRGETSHAQLIGEAVTRALMQIQLELGIPVIHEVLLLENKAQAVARCLSRDHNRGFEAAQTALAMAQMMGRLDGLDGHG